MGTSPGSPRPTCRSCRTPSGIPRRCRSTCNQKRVTRMRTGTDTARRSLAVRALALGALLWLAAAPAWGVTVKSISLKESGTSTQVVVEADGPMNYHDFTLESPDRIVLDCPGATLGMTDRTWAGRENSTVKSVRASEMGWGKDTGTRVVIDLAQAASYGVSAVGNNVVLAVEAPGKDAPAASGAPPRPPDDTPGEAPDGRRMSLDVQGAEIQTVLRSLAEFSGRNIVASKEVKGEVTLRVRNVPWRHALDILLKSQGLGMVERGNTILVSTLETLRKEEMERRLAAQRNVDELLPLETRIVPISYANSDEMAK